MPILFIITAINTLVLFLLAFLLAVALRNNGLVDIFWGLGFVLIALTASLFAYPTFAGQLIIVYVVVWGLRLAWHIGKRNLGKPEDFRYASWRKEWGKYWLIRSFFQIYILQWILMQLVAIPIVLGITTQLTISPWMQYLGMAIWLTGFFFEVVGDYQLEVFKSKPANKGKLMTTGLWRFTRHPNYFGEAILWWGIALLAYGNSGNLAVFIGPLTINLLLLYVSGIPLLEKKYQGRSDWQLYASKTSAFFPLPPRKG